MKKEYPEGEAMHVAKSRYPEGEAMHLAKSRLEALTDGIFAFSMTLLVVGINIPEKAALVQSTPFVTNLLFSLWSDFFHYVLAFLILGAFWLSHHVELHPVSRLTGRMSGLIWEPSCSSPSFLSPPPFRVIFLVSPSVRSCSS